MKEEDYIYIFVKTFLFFDRFVKAFNLRNVNFSFSKSDFCYNEEEKKKQKKKSFMGSHFSSAQWNGSLGPGLTTTRLLKKPNGLN